MTRYPARADFRAAARFASRSKFTENKSPGRQRLPGQLRIPPITKLGPHRDNQRVTGVKDSGSVVWPLVSWHLGVRAKHGIIIVVSRDCRIGRDKKQSMPRPQASLLDLDPGYAELSAVRIKFLVRDNQVDQLAVKVGTNLIPPVRDVASTRQQVRDRRRRDRRNHSDRGGKHHGLCLSQFAASPLTNTRRHQTAAVKFDSGSHRRELPGTAAMPRARGRSRGELPLLSSGR